ncbi:MAG: leucine-rich repeat protein [Bacteroidales bacterium]|nr:leucine-rich repeat protein [Bacteroidales bacterium]
MTAIGYHAFGYSSGLTSVTIPSSVTEIAWSAFEDCNIAKIEFTGSLAEWCEKEWSPSSISNSYDLYINGKKVEGYLATTLPGR